MRWAKSSDVRAAPCFPPRRRGNAGARAKDRENKHLRSPHTAESSDFTGGEFQFTVQPDEQQATVRVGIINDEITEQPKEQFSLTLSVWPQSGLSVGNTHASVCIIDNDGRVNLISIDTSIS